jgi:hypothetical protein
MAVAESNYGRVDHALFYVDAIAKLLDLEMPGALPEIAPSPAYDPFQPLTSRAMFMQAWSAYGVQWPLIRYFLGVDPNVPGRTLTVVPDLPTAWPSASVNHLRVGDGELSVSTSRSAGTFTTKVSAPRGLTLTLGQVIPPTGKIASVQLDGRPAKYSVVETDRGREVHVLTGTASTHTAVIVVN